jgi:hypothetical protein
MAACGGATHARTDILEQVDTTPTRRSADGCAFLIHAALVNGGTQTTCISSLDGVPGPGVVMHSNGTMTFGLRNGSIRTRVRITQRFGPDGAHAHQTVRGSIVGGTRAYAAARGTISGRGTLIDRASGLGPVDLRYTLLLTSP